MFKKTSLTIISESIILMKVELKIISKYSLFDRYEIDEDQKINTELIFSINYDSQIFIMILSCS